jgi:hypothetical protein
MAAKAKKQPYGPQTGPQPTYQQKSKVVSLQAPIGGWNRRDPIPEMAPTDAIIMDNLIPGNGNIQIRGGSTKWATGLGSFVESLMEYSSPTGNKLFAAVPTAIYDVTGGGAVGGAVQSGLANGRWQHVNFATAGGDFLVIANGADSVRNYDGTTWTTPAITGVTSSTLVGVNVHAQRLWFIPNNSLSAWYLPVSSIAGAAVEFPIGQYCKLGGYIVAMGSWSQNGATGMYDLAVFVTSQGEMVVYKGTDPDTDFQQVGVFKIAQPIGHRCMLKSGSDLAILTAIGMEPISKILPYNLSTQGTVSVTDKINGAFKEYYLRGGNFFGWQVIEYPKAELIIINAPYAERATQHQFVMNARTGAWCRFTGLNGGCWGTLGSNVYFGDNSGNVWQYDVQYNDGGAAITATVQQAYADAGTPQNKRFVAARPIVEAPSGIVPAVVIKLDYDTSAPSIPLSSFAPAASAFWDAALWNVSFWDEPLVPSLNWQSLSGMGRVGSIAMAFATANSVSVNGMDIIFEPGGYF